MSKTTGTIVFVLYLLFGLYLINSAFAFFTISGFVLSIDKWIVSIAGILIIFAGIGYMRAARRNDMSYLGGM